MSPPFIGSKEAFPAPAAPVPELVCVVGDDVPLHVRVLREPGRTERAAVWPLSRMGTHMQFEILPRNEPGQAHLALEGLHAIVGLHMCNVIGGVVELGAALFTLADHLPCVDASVYCQVAFLCVRLPAEVTHVRPGTAVCPAAVCQ